MDERRKWKNVQTVAGVRKFKQLNNELRRETEKAREEWLVEESKELDELQCLPKVVGTPIPFKDFPIPFPFLCHQWECKPPPPVIQC